MGFNPFKAAEDGQDTTNIKKEEPNRGITISSKPISEEIIRRFGKLID